MPEPKGVPGMITMLPGGEITFADYWRGILPKQLEFHRSTQRYAAYIGGQGAGKSVTLCGTAITYGQITPGGLILIGRLHMPALKDTTRRIFMEMIPKN